VPKDENNKRYFMSDENIPRRHYYKVENWVKSDEWPRRRKRLTDEDLSEIDFMTVEVTPEAKPTDVSYITIWGPFPDWTFVEGILAYDYGSEGSRIYPTAA
jgi:hypothetical protein